MKRYVVSLMMILFLSQTLFAQSPNKFKYQAVIRNSEGSVISNQHISVQITLLNGINGDSSAYIENHFISTNAYGVVNLEVGGGEIEFGDFSSIDWSKGIHFIQLALDLDGGVNYIVLGASQLLSVPYALHAKTVEFDLVDDDDSDSLNEIQTLEIAETKLSITKGNTIDLSPLILWIDSATTINYNRGDVEIGSPISPQATFTVSNENPTIGFIENVSVADFQRSHSGSTARLMIYAYPDVASLLHLRKSAMVYATGDAESLVLAAAQPLGNIRFFTQSTFFEENERMRIDKNGNVGIGTTTPSYKLDVNGTINATDLFLNGSPVSTISKWVGSGGDISYATGNVTVGSPISPQATFTVSNENPTIGFTENVSVADFQRSHSGSTARLMIYAYPDVASLLHLRKSAMVYATGDAESLVLAAAQPLGNIRFFTQSTFFEENERMRIDKNGNVGIGTTSPKTKLQISSGDIFIEEISSGVIMKSPDGNCWRMTLDNTGSIVTSSIVCPI